MDSARRRRRPATPGLRYVWTIVDSAKHSSTFPRVWIAQQDSSRNTQTRPAVGTAQLANTQHPVQKFALLAAPGLMRTILALRSVKRVQPGNTKIIPAKYNARTACWARLLETPGGFNAANARQELLGRWSALSADSSSQSVRVPSR